MIPALGLGKSAFPATPRLRFAEAGARVDVLVDGGASQHVLWRQGDSISQLAVTGVSVLDAPYLYTELPLPAALRGHRLAAIAAFSGLRAPSPDKAGRSREGRLQRLHFVLRALDADLAGLSQRETAILLFGHASVESAWDGGAGYMRDRVRRAIGRGRHLMAMGYQDFLR